MDNYNQRLLEAVENAANEFERLRVLKEYELGATVRDELGTLFVEAQEATSAEHGVNALIDRADHLNGVVAALEAAATHEGDPGYKEYINDELIPFAQTEHKRAEAAVDACDAPHGAERERE